MSWNLFFVCVDPAKNLERELFRSSPQNPPICISLLHLLKHFGCGGQALASFLCYLFSKSWITKKHEVRCLQTLNQKVTARERCPVTPRPEVTSLYPRPFKLDFTIPVFFGGGASATKASWSHVVIVWDPSWGWESAQRGSLGMPGFWHYVLSRDSIM